MRREPDSLRFASGKRAALAIQREIAEPNLDKKLQARLNFANDVADDGLLLRGQLESSNKLQGCLYGLFTELMDVQLAPMSILNRDSQDFRFKSCAAAHFAPLAGHERANPSARELALCLLV